MNDNQLEELLDSVRDMGRHMRGQEVAGIKAQEFPEPDVKAIRERTGVQRAVASATPAVPFAPSPTPYRG